MKVGLQKQKGSVNWYVVYWDGRRRKRVWRSTGLKDRAEAEAVRAEVEASLNGRLNQERVRGLLESVGDVKVEGAGVPLSRLWSLYEEMPKPRETRERTERSKRQRIERFLKWLAAKRPEVETVQGVTERVAWDYFSCLSGEGLTGQTRNNTRSDLRSVWNVIRVRCGIERNPWDAVQRVEARNLSYRPLSLDEAARLYKLASEGAVVAREGTFWPAAIAMGWHHGLRLGDICELDWEEVLFDDGFMRLVPNKGWKSGRRLSYVRHQDWMRWVESAPTAGELTGEVWPGVAEGYRKQGGWLGEEFGGLLRAAGIEAEVKVKGRRRPAKAVTFHSLRHSFCTGSIEEGATLDDVRLGAGQSTAAMTIHYVHTADRVARKLARKRQGLG